MINVELLDSFGGDLMVVNTARVSFGKEKDIMDMGDAKLINYLVKHGHTSPFRHPQLQYRISCPIFVERQLFKHQVGMSANSISGRYVDFSDEYTVPTELRKQSTDSKQGSDGTLNRPDLLNLMSTHINNGSELYSDLCNAGVAKEQARMILPLALNTKFIWTGSFLSFTHLFNLRLKPDAQQETREVVTEILNQVKMLSQFEYSIKAFGV